MPSLRHDPDLLFCRIPPQGGSADVPYRLLGAVFLLRNHRSSSQGNDASNVSLIQTTNLVRLPLTAQTHTFYACLAA